MDKLKPCPFCGADAETVEGVLVYVKCPKCGANGKRVRPRRLVRIKEIFKLSDDYLDGLEMWKEIHKGEVDADEQRCLKEAMDAWNRRTTDADTGN